jgi:hypothetical protein
MAVKTITIDLEAYDALARHKGPGHFGPRKTVAAFRRSLREIDLSDRTLEGIERTIRSRTKSPARVPTL